MAPVRVMLVDDAVVIRHVLTESLSRDPELLVVGTASDGVQALEKLPGFNPDVVILDVEMPNMDGIETLSHIKKRWPTVRVVMFSTLTSRGAEATMDALMMGADDYVTKPSNTSGIQDAISRINGELVPKIKALGASRAARSTAGSGSATALSRITSRPSSAATSADRFMARPAQPAAPAAPSSDAAVPKSSVPPQPPRIGAPAATSPSVPATPIRPVVRGPRSKPDVVVIAVSTGGPNALMEMMPQLPGDLAVPVVIVQHIPPTFSKALATRLNQKCALDVDEASDGVTVRPGQAWIAPGDFHITLAREGVELKIRTNQGPPENSCRPAADVLFRSAGALFGPNVLGVVLTGMGYDGAKGSKQLVDNGASVIAQDQATSVVWGMPGAVADGIAEAVLPLNRIAAEITARVGTAHSSASKSTTTTGGIR